MILSTGRNYLFIHMPKTGGTALALALEARAMADDMMLGDTPKAVKRRRRLQGVKTNGRLWKHSTLADLRGLLPEDTMRGLFTFTMVRNPWDRLLSLYCWLQAQRFSHPMVVLARQLEFDAFLKHPATQGSVRQATAAWYVTDASGRQQCDVFIRLEHFQTDAAPLFDHLGFALSLPRINQSREDRDWRPYYTDETADIVARICAEEIRRFEYSFNDLPVPLS